MIAVAIEHVFVEVRPITLRDARAFVQQHHRHNRPPQGWLFGAGLWEGETLVGVAIAGRPVARNAQDGTTVEVTRVCTLGHRNANSRLYAAICRAAAALGYRRAITYTLGSESGSSLLAAGFARDGHTSEGPTWAREERGRHDETLWGERTLPNEPRIRWMRVL